MKGRSHGDPPYQVVVVHGGPGAPGSAHGLAKRIGRCLEPFQTANTLEGQVAELAQTIRKHAAAPAVLVGHSWGAMLALLTAAEHPPLVQKVVMVGSGGFSAESYLTTHENRMSRLSAEDREKAETLRAQLKANPDEPLSEQHLAYYDLISATDAYDPDPDAENGCEAFQNDVNKHVWAGAVALRESGELLRRVSSVLCPVVAIHGAYDPHPAEAVSEPLSRVLGNFTMHVLGKCGHEPWKERQARDSFFELLLSELPLPVQ